MLHLVLIAFALVYVSGIARSGVRCLESRACVKTLTDFIVAADTRRPTADSRVALLRQYPLIEKFVKFPALSYSQSPSELLSFSKIILDDLQMVRNRHRFALWSSFNPLSAGKQLLGLPVAAVRTLGFHPGRGGALVISVLGWLAAYLLGMFEPELKALLLSLL